MTNPGTGDISDPIVKDVVPNYTGYLNGSAGFVQTADLVAGSISAPASGTSGLLSFPFTGVLKSGQRAVVQFTVKLDE